MGLDWSLIAQTVLSIATILFVAGKTYGRISGQETTLKRHDDTLLDHSTRIEDLETQAAIDNARREGFRQGRESIENKRPH